MRRKEDLGIQDDDEPSHIRLCRGKRKQTSETEPHEGRIALGC